MSAWLELLLVGGALLGAGGYVVRTFLRTRSAACTASTDGCDSCGVEESPPDDYPMYEATPLVQLGSGNHTPRP